MSRREMIAGAGTAVVGLGGVYALTSRGSGEVRLDALTTLESANLDLSPEGEILEATIGGSVEIEYESPDIPIREAQAGFNLDYHGADGIEGPDVSPLDVRKRAETGDPHSGSLSFDFNASLIAGWGFELSHFDPEPGTTITHDFLLVAGASVYETVGGDDAIEAVRNEDYGEITVDRSEDEPDAEPVLALTTSEFRFTFQTGGQ
jgi:hypothetical protein